MLFWAVLFYILGAVDFIYTARCFSLKVLSLNVFVRSAFWPVFTTKLWADELIEDFKKPSP